MGPGVLDSQLARTLGVSTRILGGELWLSLDDIYGDATTDFREVTPNGAFGSITVVPEPTVPALLALTTGAAALRRRFRR
jgi:hypothetical protein